MEFRRAFRDDLGQEPDSALRLRAYRRRDVPYRWSAGAFAGRRDDLDGTQCTSGDNATATVKAFSIVMLSRPVLAHSHRSTPRHRRLTTRVSLGVRARPATITRANTYRMLHTDQLKSDGKFFLSRKSKLWRGERAFFFFLLFVLLFLGYFFYISVPFLVLQFVNYFNCLVFLPIVIKIPTCNRRFLAGRDCNFFSQLQILDFFQCFIFEVSKFCFTIFYYFDCLALLSAREAMGSSPKGTIIIYIYQHIWIIYCYNRVIYYFIVKRAIIKLWTFVDKK